MPITCHQCEYDLTGTPRSSRCPECGMSAEVSYQRAENRAVRRPLHPLSVFTIVICAIGLVTMLAALITAVEIDDFVAVVFVGGILLWNASPFIALAAMAYLGSRRLFPAVTCLVGSVVLLAWCGFYVADFHRSTSSSSALNFLFAPLYSWVWVIFIAAILTISRWIWHFASGLVRCDP